MADKVAAADARLLREDRVVAARQRWRALMARLRDPRWAAPPRGISQAAWAWAAALAHGPPPLAIYLAYLETEAFRGYGPGRP